MVLEVNGKKVFPIAFTMPPPPGSKAPNGKNSIEELRAAGATFLRTGVMARAWDEETIAQEQEWLDAAARNGMLCLLNPRELSSIEPDDAAKEALLRRLVNRFKDHPGLGAWKGVDEPEWNKHPIAPMLRARDIIRELDPDHPIEITQAPRGTIETLRPYNQTCDIIAADVYPVSYPPGIHSLLPNKEISMVGDYTRTMMEVAQGKMPVWMTLQIAWSGVINPGKTLRFPTQAQERFMTYQAIINGARGLIFFGGHITKSLSPEDAALGWNWKFWNSTLRPVVEEVGQWSPLYPALVVPNSPVQLEVRGPDNTPRSDVEFCVREVGDELFILACKREGETVRVEFSGLPGWARDGDVLYEAPRKVTVENGRFSDWFGPFDVHVYRFRRMNTPTTR